MRPGSWHSVYHPIKGGHPAKQKAEHVITDPYLRFGAWFAEAKTTEPNDPNAMILATAAPNPSARTVLLKAWDERGFVFYTNLESRKSNALASNPHAALLFYWKILHRQVRIEGVVALVEAHEADAYFATRPRDSQAGAWASAQSKPLPDRETFETRLTDIKARYEGMAIPRPPFWSGWRLVPDYFEFWQDQQYRLHDRQTYRRTADGWETGLLYP
jgi:pyridoxamine 5'-phosphate oxidase